MLSISLDARSAAMSMDAREDDENEMHPFLMDGFADVE
jgi:hypothetical protein